MITIENLSKTFGKQKVLDQINLSFGGGKSLALLGPNGSGKTTLIKIILGLVLPDEGEIRVLGQEISRGPTYRQQIGYMPQISRYPEQMKVSDLFRLVKTLRNDVASTQYDQELYHALNIDRMQSKSLGALSGGMKQQVSAALAFYFAPDILILDEPTAALDPVSNEILKAKIRKTSLENKLVITTSHILSDLDEICDHVVYLLEGKVFYDGDLDDLRTKTQEDKLNRMVVSLMQAS
jgi:Cu-processing system ATP-binding protein